jgi:peptidoglycan/LPS O-acetylase OafA/YrhL
MLAIYRVFYSDLSIDYREEIYGHPFDPMVIISVITAFYVIFYIIATGKINFPGGKFVAMIGALTYPLYLIHCTIGLPIIEIVEGTVNKYVVLIMVSALVILISYLINIFVENRYAGKFKIALTALASRLGFDKLNHVTND